MYRAILVLFFVMIGLTVFIMSEMRESALLFI